MNIFNYEINDIDKIIDIISKIEIKGVLLMKYNISNVYFIGSTLCVDIKDSILNELDVIMISYHEESYGFFSGGFRRLLSLKSLRNLEKIMKINGIWFQKNDLINLLYENKKEI